MHDKDFQKNVETRLDIWDHLATIFFYTVIHWDFVYIMHGRGLPIFWKVYMYIYWIFCDFIALRYQLGSFLLTKTFMSIMSRLIYYKSLYILFWWACCSPLLYFFITQQQLGKMARLQQTQRKRVGSVPRLPVDVVAAIAAEVDLL